MFTFNDLLELKKLANNHKIKSNKELFDNISSLYSLANSDISSHVFKYAGCYIETFSINGAKSLSYLNYKLYLRILFYKIAVANVHPADEVIVLDTSIITIRCNEAATKFKKYYRSLESDHIVTAQKMIDHFDRALKPLFNRGDLVLAQNNFDIAKESKGLFSSIKLNSDFDTFNGYYFAESFRAHFKKNLITFSNDEIILPTDVQQGWLIKVKIKATQKLKEEISSYKEINHDYELLIDLLADAVDKYVNLYN